MSGFKGFSTEGLEFLTTLGSKDKSWLDVNRGTYQSKVAETAKSFVDALGPILQDTISPDLEFSAKVNGSIAPINNDIRFSPDASPYKDHLLFKFWEGPDKKIAPRLYVRLSEESVGFASGVFFHDVDAWRAKVDDDKAGAQLVEVISQVNRSVKGLDVAGAALKRVPKPFNPEHPRADLLRHKSLQLRWSEPTPKGVTSARFVDWTTKRLQKVAPLHHWLVEHL
jgi:uncharacterized protein (TIGR02453 family)